MTNFLC